MQKHSRLNSSNIPKHSWKKKTVPEEEVVAPVWEYSEVRTAEQTRIGASSCLERQGVAKANDGERETFVNKIEALQKDEAWIKENDIASISVQTPTGFLLLQPRILQSSNDQITPLFCS